MEALDVVSSRENALDREAAFGSGDDAVDSSIGADVGPLDFIYASGLVIATIDDVGLRSPHASLCKQFGNCIVKLFGEQPSTIKNLKFFRIIKGCVVSVIAGDEPIPVI